MIDALYYRDFLHLHHLSLRINYCSKIESSTDSSSELQVIEVELGPFFLPPLFPPAQSEHQMNVPHLHCVPASFSPLGPNGRAHIQKLLPWLEPFFFVCIVLHGSSWPSHIGAAGLAKSTFQDLWLCSLAASWFEISDGEGLAVGTGEAISTGGGV